MDAIGLPLCCCCWTNVLLGLPFMVVFGVLLWLWNRARKARVYAVPEASTDSVFIITGCDSGIGRATALGLVQAGFHVVATTFTEEGPARLIEDARGLCGELSTMHVDVTSDTSVEEFVDDLLERYPTKNVAGLLNNAGVILSGPIETQPFHYVLRQFEVNLFGQVRVTQALLPYVRRNASTLGGRVVNLVSIAGRISSDLIGAYSASKHSMEAVTDSLRREVRKFNVSVSAIEPGFVQTPLLAGLAPEALEHNQDTRGTLYKELFDRVERNHVRVYSNGTTPEIVASNIVHAFTSPNPKTRYLVGSDARLLAAVQWLLPSALADEFLLWLEGLVLE